MLRIQVNPKKSLSILRELQGAASCLPFELIRRRGWELRRIQVNPKKASRNPKKSLPENPPEATDDCVMALISMIF